LFSVTRAVFQLYSGREQVPKYVKKKKKLKKKYLETREEWGGPRDKYGELGRNEIFSSVEAVDNSPTFFFLENLQKRSLTCS